MILLKGFFRKKKTTIYIRIFSIIITILFLLNGINHYINEELNRIKYENSSFIMFSLNNHDELLKKEKNIVTYNRALPLSKGEDNDIIYTPKYIINNDGSISYESVDYSKIEWKRLIYDEENYSYILTFSASYCNTDLNDNEVILALEENIDYRQEYKDKYLDNNISFIYNQEKLDLKIKNIIESKNFKYVCISKTLYNELSKKEDKYIYLINTNNYNSIEKLKEKWKNLESNNFYSIQTNTTYYEIETENNKTSLSNLANMLQIANIISFIIFIIMVIFVTKDLISDEEENILLLRQIGYNKKQIIKNTLKNILLLDLIVILISLIFSLIISTILNIILNLSIQVFSLTLIIGITIFITIFELVFIFKLIQKLDK